jgi:hypothetical protein
MQRGQNYGILCGAINKITVVDVDDYKSPNNPELLERFTEILTNHVDTYTVSTPSGGKHYYF